MSAALASTDQVRALQTARRRQGLDEPTYRDALAGYGVASTKALTRDQASSLLDKLNGQPSLRFDGHAATRPARLKASGPFGDKLQALWISAYNLGVVRDPDDAALLAFVERQTGITHTRFLVDPLDAARAIEAVKAMLTRDGGVVWPKRKGKGAEALKAAVVTAQVRRLGALGIAVPPGPLSPTPANLDAHAKRLGKLLRAALRSDSAPAFSP